MPVITGLSGMRCDKPGCRHVEFLDDGQRPRGFSGTVYRAEETGADAQVADWYACSAPHLKEAIKAALGRAVESEPVTQP